MKRSPEVFVGVLGGEYPGKPVACRQLVLTDHQLPQVVRGQIVQYS